MPLVNSEPAWGTRSVGRLVDDLPPGHVGIPPKPSEENGEKCSNDRSLLMSSYFRQGQFPGTTTRELQPDGRLMICYGIDDLWWVHLSYLLVMVSVKWSRAALLQLATWCNSRTYLGEECKAVEFDSFMTFPHRRHLSLWATTCQPVISVCFSAALMNCSCQNTPA
jgi:hypothetical protein